jgi:hypothetical protein
MKKLLIILTLFLITIAAQAQSIWKPVQPCIFSPTALKASGTNSIWLWRLSAVVVADELTYNKVTKSFDSTPLSSLGPAIGYRHFTKLSDGSPYNDFGINAAVLLGTDINHISTASMKAAIIVNAFKFINIGGAYTFNVTNHFSILLGASINF